MNPDLIGALFLATFALLLAAWALSGYLRDLNHRAEEKRREHDRAAFLAALAAEEYAKQRRQDAANLAVADAFRAAMEQHPSTRARMDRIRQQIAANEAERELRAALADDEALARWLA